MNEVYELFDSEEKHEFVLPNKKSKIFYRKIPQMEYMAKFQAKANFRVEDQSDILTPENTFKLIYFIIEETDAITGWEGFSKNGKPLEFNDENKKLLRSMKYPELVALMKCVANMEFTDDEAEKKEPKKKARKQN